MNENRWGGEILPTQPTLPEMRQPMWLKFLGGFLGWFLVSTLVANTLSQSWAAAMLYWLAYLPVNVIVMVVLGLRKTMRWIVFGMIGAMATNFLIAVILGTYLSPFSFVPVTHPDVYRFRRNFQYVPKDISTPGVTSPCAVTAAVIPSDGYHDRIAFVSDRGGNQEIYVMNADGSGQTNLTNDPAFDGFPVWSPDGLKIAFLSDRDGNLEIYIMNADGSKQTRITEDPANDYIPAWSPNGQQIVFYSDRDRNSEIYLMNVDGSAQTNLTNNPANDLHPAWSPDGLKIAFQSDRKGKQNKNPILNTNNFEIFVMDIDGSNVTRLTRNARADWSPAWSPDGSCIVYHSGLFNNTDIYVTDLSGANQVRLTTKGYSPRWSPDGMWLVFGSNRDGNMEIYSMHLDGSMLRRLTNNPAVDSDPQWQPDTREKP